MPKVSKSSTTMQDHGDHGKEWGAELDGYSASFVEVGVDADNTPLLKGLPGDQCPCPHWGYVLKGRMWWRFDDRTEEIGPGEAFYVEPGHTSGADAGSEFVIFSPSEIYAEVNAHMGRRAQELMAH